MSSCAVVSDVHAVRAQGHDIRGILGGVNRERPAAVICPSGQQSAVAASLLLRHGAGHVIHVADGGVAHWRATGWPVEKPPDLNSVCACPETKVMAYT
jgi:hydroxyacylglutathione hydrolase